MSRAWILFGSVVTVAALAVGTVGVVAVLAHEELTQRSELDATGIDRLELRTDRGSVLVEGADTDRITIEAEVSHGLRHTRTEVDVRSSTAVVRASCPHPPGPWCSVDYRVVVPAALAVDVAAHDGSLTIRDITGAVDVEGRNGPVELDGLTGDVRARTANGGIDGTDLSTGAMSAHTRNGAVRVRFARAPSTVDASTRNGRVEVIVPEGSETYRVHLHTRRGDTELAVRTDPASPRTISAETVHGRATVRYSTD